MGSDTVVVHTRQSVLMMNGDCAHKDGTMMFPLTIVHPLGVLHASISGLRISKLLGSETVRGEVGANGGDETLDRFDRVVGLADITSSRGCLVQSLADSLEEGLNMLMSGVVGVGQDHARLVRWGKFQDLVGHITDISLWNYLGTHLSACIPPVLEACDSRIKLYDPLRTWLIMCTALQNSFVQTLSPNALFSIN
jgi:hypothetical protein